MKPQRINGILIFPPILPQMIAFKGHERELLSCLREAHQRGPKPKPFDEIEALDQLIRLARLYFSEKETPKTIPAAEWVKRLRKFESALGGARRIADLMQNDLESALTTALIAEKNIPLVWQTIRDTAPSINKMLANLAVLERLARRASDSIRATRGRRKGGSVLSVDYIHGLARVYRQTTGRKPSIAEGPFARFVRAFLTAIGERLKHKYVVELIETARNQVRDGYPDLWAISAFNPNGGNNRVQFS